MDWVPVNWGLLKNPINWVIVILMITIAAFGLSVLLGGVKPAGNS